MTMPSIQPVDDELAASLRAQFGAMLEEEGMSPADLAEISPKAIDDSPLEEQPAPKRGPGRPRLPRDEYGNIIRSESSSGSVSVRRNPLPAASLTKREERQVTERLANILTGATGVASLAKPYFAMTEDEAKAIAEPLSSYLIRMEPTSKVAKQILDEYDLVAVVMAVMAYGVRVVLDFQKEREASKNVPKEHGLEPIRRRAERSLPDDGQRSNESVENDAGSPRYVGPISTPNVQGNGLLPGL